MKKILLLVVVCCLTLTGCATIPRLQAPVVRESTYNVSYDKIWPHLVTIVTEGGNFVNVADKGSGILTYTTVLNKEQLKEYVLQKPPAVPIGAYYNNGEAQITLRVRKVDENSIVIKVSSKIKAQICNMFGTVVPPFQGVMLNSNGNLEKDTFKMVEAQAGLKQYKWM
ncbi:hypothetical protein ACFL5E_02480 [Candidatus Omnitrophota bacterium]